MFAEILRGIVFDVDGVLFDTEPLHIKAWKKTAETFGFSLTMEELIAWTGKPCGVFASFLSSSKQSAPSKKTLLDMKEELFKDYISRSLYFNEDIRGFLGKLSRELPLAWATSSPRDNIELMFYKADIMKYFSFGVCIEDVENPKPDPESYLKAASGLNLSPGDCIALDDTPTGIASAADAGFYTLGIEGVFGEDDLKRSTKVFPSTPDALRWLLSNYGKKY